MHLRGCAAETRRFDGIAHEQGDGHGTDAAWDRSKRARGIDGVGVNVTDEDRTFLTEFCQALRKILEELLDFDLVGNFICADVDYRRAGFEPIGLYVTGFAHGRHYDVGPAYDTGKITRLRVADRDGGVGVHEEQGHWFADDVTATEDDGVYTLDGDFVAAENFHAARGRACDEAFTAADEFSEVDGMKTVNVFCGVNDFENLSCVHLFWKRELNQNAVHIVVAIELVHEFEHFFRCDGGGRRVQPTGDAELFAGGDFAFYVELRRRIFADEDGCEAWADTLGHEAGDFVLQFDENLVADFQSIEDSCGHAALTFVTGKSKNSIGR